MTFFFYYAALFCAKVFDNTLSTTKTILIQRNRSLLAGLTVAVSDFIYFMLIKNVLSADNLLAVAVVSAAGGIGCCLAVSIGNRLSKDRLFVNVVMSDIKPRCRISGISWLSITSRMSPLTAIQGIGARRPSPSLHTRKRKRRTD